MKLEELGWDNFYNEHFKEYEVKGLVKARVVLQQKNYYLLRYKEGVTKGKLAGKFRHKATLKKHFPSVGDWVVIKIVQGSNEAIIHGVLPRKTAFVRKMPISGGRKIRNGEIVGGLPEEQVIASNIDTAFIVCGLDGNFNLHRIERYITLVYNSGATPVVILNKMDLCDDVNEYIDKVKKIAIGVSVYPISVTKSKNLDIFNEYLLFGMTVVFLGSSGVGKSTITNYLIGEERQKTNTTSDSNGKGKHTTTSAELLFHSSGYMIIDTPGLRELQLWGDEEALDESFEDIVELIRHCRFNDCRHDTEPGCAIKQAIEEERISRERYQSYKKQLNELNRASKIAQNAQRYRDRVAKQRMHSGITKDFRRGEKI